MPKPLLHLPAILWHNQVRLEGEIVLYEDRLRFQYEKPKRSELNLVIPKKEIHSIEEYLLFGIQRKGIRIRSGKEREDQFIVEDPRKVRKVLRSWLGT